MKIVFLDSIIINPEDISWEPMKQLGEFKAHQRTTQGELLDRIGDAQAIFTDAVSIDRKAMESCPNIKFIGVAATGYDHIDIEAAEELGIAVCNVPAYSTDSVSQQTLALLIAITNRVDVYNAAVSDGQWYACEDYTFIKSPVTLLAGKSIGIVGYGNIGKKVAEIANAFGMTVNVYSQDKEAVMKSDIISLHCPLTRENEKMVDRGFIGRMKDGAILINTARGKLIDEEALAAALKSGKLAGAGLDVLSEEPPKEGHPLIGIENCYITPHIGFIPFEMRKIVCDTCAFNLKSFMEGGSSNRIV